MWNFTDAFVLLFVMLGCVRQRCDGSEAFGFDIHHRFSEPVKAMFNIDDDLPERGTVDYYAAMVHRDRFFHGRRLAEDQETPDHIPLTFADGNATVRIDYLGFLYYANVTVGTPGSWYLVALDTGSHLFWLPCDCSPNCVDGLQLSPTEILSFNIYSPSASSTAAQLSCTNPDTPSRIDCPYRVVYLSKNTSSSGYLVEDVLHLTTDTGPSTLSQARISFGCGVVLTGSFLKTAAPNGLLGLSMDAISVPTTLANQNLTANSFSMCFSKDGVGKISFGDKGSKDQRETPFNPNRLNLYDVSITQVTVGSNVSAANFTVIIDSGTSFTFLTDPAYTLLSEKFDSQIEDERVEVDPDSPFNYCYETNSSLSDLVVPPINLTMRGGDQFSVIHPSIKIGFQDDDRLMYCLAIVKSDEEDINIIGENFMTGYRVVFDHEKMVLGWEKSDCDEVVPVGPQNLSPRRSDTSSASTHDCFIVIILLVQILSLHVIIF